MTIYVYTDLATKYSRIHKALHDGGGGRYEKRKRCSKPDNWWHGPYSTLEDAEAAAIGTKTSKVEVCHRGAKPCFG